MGQAGPKGRPLETQELILRDSSEKLRAAFGAYQDGPRLVLTGDDERPRVDVTVKGVSPVLQTLDADGKVTWSAPGNPAPQIIAGPDRRPRVFIELFKFGRMWKGSENTEEMAVFGQAGMSRRCVDNRPAEGRLHAPPGDVCQPTGRMQVFTPSD